LPSGEDGRHLLDVETFEQARLAWPEPGWDMLFLLPDAPLDPGRVKPRKLSLPPAAPEHLARYVASEWADEDNPFRAWCRARLDYAAEHPDGPLGHPLDLLAEHRRPNRKAAAPSPIQ
jgi:hypothetical protein